ncbi:MAG TPA: GDSL-type esterase/lipase family protein [Frankiaceae bacterium]|nr:GDSL-type esterase/lipase family protein [Frankiaceae bacterium]
MLLDEALRGAAWPGNATTPYPRSEPADDRLPGDTWGTAQIPVGVRLELLGDASGIEIDYTCGTEDLGYRGEGAGTHFSAWRGDTELASVAASPSGGTARLELTGSANEPFTVYIPEGLKPTLKDVRATGGTLHAAPAGPRWLAYGDSLTEGWIASGPAHCWPSLVARRHGLDLVNLGYAGSCRGELASAEQIAKLPADVIALGYGTNCWSRVPYSTALLAANLRAFLSIVREGHPETPIVVWSPVIRPDAEQTPNRLGATLADLRAEVESFAADPGVPGPLELVRGLPLLRGDQLPDGVHPGDEGHVIMAEAIGEAVAGAVARSAGRNVR